MLPYRYIGFHRPGTVILNFGFIKEFKMIYPLNRESLRTTYRFMETD